MKQLQIIFIVFSWEFTILVVQRKYLILYLPSIETVTTKLEDSESL